MLRKEKKKRESSFQEGILDCRCGKRMTLKAAAAEEEEEEGKERGVVEQEREH